MNEQDLHTAYAALRRRFMAAGGGVETSFKVARRHSLSRYWQYSASVGPHGKPNQHEVKGSSRGKAAAIGALVAWFNGVEP